MAERPLLDELAEGVRTVRFRNALARQLVMLAGVFVLGWAPLEIAVFFLLEAFLFLSLRAAAEITVDPQYGGAALTPFVFVRQFVVHWLLAAFCMAVLVGGFGAFAVIPAFPEEAWSDFVARGMRSPFFLAGLTLLAGSLVFDTALFARRVAAGRGAEERAQDDHSVRVALATVACLAMASFFIGIAARLGVGPKVLALGMAGAALYVAAAPHRATKMFQPPAPAG